MILKRSVGEEKDVVVDAWGLAMLQVRLCGGVKLNVSEIALESESAVAAYWSNVIEQGRRNGLWNAMSRASEVGM